MLSTGICVLILVGLLSINLSYGMDAFGLRSSCVTKIHTDNNPWLCFVANSTNSSVALNKVGESAYYKLPVITLEYSRDGLLWNEYAWTESAGNVIVLSNKGDMVYFKAGSGGNAAFSRSQQMRYCFSLTGSVAAKGNIQSLLDATMQQTSVPGNAFAGLFRECECLP